MELRLSLAIWFEVNRDKNVLRVCWGWGTTGEEIIFLVEHCLMNNNLPKKCHVLSSMGITSVNYNIQTNWMF